MLVETMTFQLAERADIAAFLEADKRLQSDFAYQQPGLLRRTTAQGADGWIVIDLWSSEADADACASRWETDPVARSFMSFVEADSVAVRRYTPLD